MWPAFRRLRLPAERLRISPRNSRLGCEDEEVDYRVNCPNCSPTGIATIISLPLREIRGTQKILIPMTGKSSRNLSDDTELCLIAILASKDGQPASLEKSFPRAKISVRFTD
jgi:hypothetical protein